MLLTDVIVCIKYVYQVSNPLYVTVSDFKQIVTNCNVSNAENVNLNLKRFLMQSHVLRMCPAFALFYCTNYIFHFFDFIFSVSVAFVP